MNAMKQVVSRTQNTINQRENKMNRTNKTIGSVVKAAAMMVVLTVEFLSTPAQAADLNSASFLYKYEMDVNPNTQDLNASGFQDWVVDMTAASPTISGGVFSYDTHTSNSSDVSLFSLPDGTFGFPKSDIWPLSFSDAVGWTIETKVRVNSAEGSNPPFQMIPQGTDYFALKLSPGVTSVGSVSNLLDNSDAYHVFRMAKEAGATVISLWRDDILLTASGTADISGVNTTRLYVGDLGGSIAGNVDIDYIRLTPGAFGPAAEIPEPSAVLLWSVGGLFLLRRWRRA